MDFKNPPDKARDFLTERATATPKRSRGYAGGSIAPDVIVSHAARRLDVSIG
jgi:hypothetical protein